jgi:hypothetical protein
MNSMNFFLVNIFSINRKMVCLSSISNCWISFICSYFFQTIDNPKLKKKLVFVFRHFPYFYNSTGEKMLRAVSIGGGTPTMTYYFGPFVHEGTQGGTSSLNRRSCEQQQEDRRSQTTKLRIVTRSSA